jgi:hypothetical protein
MYGQRELALNDYIEKVKLSKSELRIEFKKGYEKFLLEIAGPSNLYVRKELNGVEHITLNSKELNQQRLLDGGYKIQITPSFEQPISQQRIMRYLTETDQIAKLERKKELLGIPTEVTNYFRYITIENAAFVLPKKENGGLKLPKDNGGNLEDLASLRLAANQPKPLFTNLFGQPKPQFVDVVHNDDVIVDGSLCVGLDCANGITFDFDTHIYKENNLRVLFDDTSSAASFSKTDWRITINDSANGGASYFGISDVSIGRRIFSLEGNAPLHALYVDDAGRVGLKTATPVLSLHTKSGNTPTLRLEQDGSSGFGLQTWDIASNETNFFIRDATNGSRLPFRIRPGAPTSSIDIATNGTVSIGAFSSPSDRRFKKEIKPLEGALTIIEQLKPKTYYYRSDEFDQFEKNTDLQYGLIAQDVQPVVGNLINKLALIEDESGEETEYLGVKYVSFIPILIKGMQEQQAIINTQKEEIATLKAELKEVAELKEQVAALAKLLNAKAEVEEEAVGKQ